MNSPVLRRGKKLFIFSFSIIIPKVNSQGAVTAAASERTKSSEVIY
jgi:hypothetical protein